MKVLIANSFHYHRGGDCTYTFELAKLLESQGHEVVHFAMEHPNNIDSDFSEYFVSQVDYDRIFDNGSLLERLKTMPKFIYSFEAKKRIEQLILDTKPDIIHVQNIHHLLTLSILSVAKKFRLPIVWTLHDYSLICPDISLLRAGAICEACSGGKFYRALLNKCKRDSASASLVVCLSSYLNQTLKRMVDIFISPSLFLKNKFIENGFDPHNIYHIPHFIDIPKDVEQNASDISKSDYFLYLGRLSPEKGIDLLIEASKEIGTVQLFIAGEGSIGDELRQLEKNNARNNIRFLGHVPAKKAQLLLKNALFLVLPSTCYENFPYSALEAFSWGKPVIASRIGGMPEQIKHGLNGLLFEPGNKVDLHQKIKYLLANRALLLNMGKQAKERVESQYSKKRHFQALIKVYERLLEEPLHRTKNTAVANVGVRHV